MSVSALWRWPTDGAIRPWRHGSWVLPRDPLFGKTACRALDLYEGRWEGKSIGTSDYAISTDEKTSIQARVRKHRSQGPRPSSAMEVEHEYIGGGALNYLAVLDVGRCEEYAGIAAFDRLVAQVMNEEPYRSAERCSG